MHSSLLSSLLSDNITVNVQKLAQRQRPRKANVYDQLHKDATALTNKIQQKRRQRDEETLKVSMLLMHLLCRAMLCSAVLCCAVLWAC